MARSSQAQCCNRIYGSRRLHRRAHAPGLVLRTHVALRRYPRDEGSPFQRAQRRAHDRARTHQGDRQARFQSQTPRLTGESLCSSSLLFPFAYLAEAAIGVSARPLANNAVYVTPCFAICSFRSRTSRSKCFLCETLGNSAVFGHVSLNHPSYFSTSLLSSWRVFIYVTPCSHRLLRRTLHFGYQGPIS